MRIDIHHHADPAQDRKLDAILNSVNRIRERVTHMSNELERLQAKVAENSDVVQSAITLIRNIKSALDRAGTDPVALQALADILDSNDQALSQAVVENTPVAPPAEPTPPEQPPTA